MKAAIKANRTTNAVKPFASLRTRGEGNHDKSDDDDRRGLVVLATKTRIIVCVRACVCVSSSCDDF